MKDKDRRLLERLNRPGAMSAKNLRALLLMVGYEPIPSGSNHQKYQHPDGDIALLNNCPSMSTIPPGEQDEVLDKIRTHL